MKQDRIRSGPVRRVTTAFIAAVAGSFILIAAAASVIGYRRFQEELRHHLDEDMNTAFLIAQITREHEKGSLLIWDSYARRPPFVESVAARTTTIRILDSDGRVLYGSDGQHTDTAAVYGSYAEVTQALNRKENRIELNYTGRWIDKIYLTMEHIEGIHWTVILERRLSDTLWSELNAFLEIGGIAAAVFLLIAFALLHYRNLVQQREAFARYYQLVEHSPDTVYVFSDKHGGLYYSPRVETLLGYPPDYLYAHPFLWHDSVHPDDKAIVTRAMNEAANGRPFTIEYRLQDANGQWHWIYDRSMKQELQSGETVIEGLAADTTERKAVEDSLQKSKSILAETQRIAKIGGWEYDVATNTGTFTDEVFRIYGTEIHNPDDGSKYYHPDDKEQVMHAFTRAIQERRPYDLEARLVDAGGAVRWVRTIGHPVVENDKVVRVIGTLMDITDRKHAEAELKEAEIKQHQLEEELLQSRKLESLGTLASGIAHDFNNILGIILGHAQRLKQMGPPSGGASKSIDAIESSAVRGASLVSKLLTFAHKSESDSQPLFVNDLVQEISQLVGATFAKSISVTTTTQDGLPPILADSAQLHQVLLNLCVNARDAMPSGGRLSIETKSVGKSDVPSQLHNAQAETYVLVTVSDTGVGMNEDTKRRIFDPFFTTKDINKGTGLGLSLVWSILQAHKATIAVDSAPNQGTTFRMYFPAASIPPASTPPRERAEASRGGSETILVIEDEPYLSELLTIHLTEAGYNVIAAADGEEGVALFQQRHKDIALTLTDLGLPRLPGDAVFKQIRIRALIDQKKSGA
ncbi:MAG: PAS domain-containing protein [Spirochaetia bacterium]|nr:PAS domain-containing protein [Spirochaetia bacterium]